MTGSPTRFIPLFMMSMVAIVGLVAMLGFAFILEAGEEEPKQRTRQNHHHCGDEDEEISVKSPKEEDEEEGKSAAAAVVARPILTAETSHSFFFPSSSLSQHPKRENVPVYGIPSILRNLSIDSSSGTASSSALSSSTSDVSSPRQPLLSPSFRDHRSPSPLQRVSTPPKDLHRVHTAMDSDDREAREKFEEGGTGDEDGGAILYDAASMRQPSRHSQLFAMDN